MCEEREKVRCQKCELVQWSDREKCRRCGAALPAPVVKIVERVVERIVFRDSPQSLVTTEAYDDANASQAIPMLGPNEAVLASRFPTMAEMECTMILAAYRRSNRRPLLAARLLGIGKTTMYRKLREINRIAA
jgi:transcriptional regulator of acetoin/glycerol metabolism